MSYGLVEGKVALVTGAGSGIGRASVLEFVKEGAKVIITDCDMKNGEETFQMIKEAGGEGILVKASVSNNDEVETMVKKAVETYGRLDCALNNAGIAGAHKLLADISEEDWDREMRINLKGVWLCMRAEITQMLKQGGGAIVNMASAAGLMGIRSDSDYVASKHGVVGLTKAAALDYASHNIRVNCVCPGLTNTPMLSSLKENKYVLAAFSSTQPLNRLAEPEEIANAAVWLCSDKASFVNGHAIAVDSGMTIEVMKLPPEIR